MNFIFQYFTIYLLVSSLILCDLTGNMRFKCRECATRSNWRGVIANHFKAKHAVAAEPLNGRDVVVLSREEAANTIGDYKKSRRLRKRKNNMLLFVCKLNTYLYACL